MPHTIKLQQELSNSDLQHAAEQLFLIHFLSSVKWVSCFGRAYLGAQVCRKPGLRSVDQRTEY